MGVGEEDERLSEELKSYKSRSKLSTMYLSVICIRLNKLPSNWHAGVQHFRAHHSTQRGNQRSCVICTYMWILNTSMVCFGREASVCWCPAQFTSMSMYSKQNRHLCHLDIGNAHKKHLACFNCLFSTSRGRRGCGGCPGWEGELFPAVVLRSVEH